MLIGRPQGCGSPVPISNTEVKNASVSVSTALRGKTDKLSLFFCNFFLSCCFSQILFSTMLLNGFLLVFRGY